LKRTKLLIETNLSNQSNLINTFQSLLFQFNIVAILGGECLSNRDFKQKTIPLQIEIKKSGKLILNGLDGVITNVNDNVRVYKDSKITCK
jgi:hypothetical protein